MLKHFGFYFIFLFSFTYINVLKCQNNEVDSIAFNVDLENIVVTGQYKPTSVDKVLYNTDVISEKAILSRGAVQLDQALQISPLVRIEQDMVLGTKIRFKGIESRNVAILIDGVPVVGRLDGAIDLSQISMQNIQRIEIIQGPLSNIYGNNAAGGVINLITKKSQLNTFNGSLEGQLENTGIQNYQASIGFQQKKFRIGLSGRLFEYDKYSEDSLRLMEKIDLGNGNIQSVAKYPWNPKKQINFGANFLYRLNDNNTVTLKYDKLKENISDYDQVRRPTFKPYSNDNFYTTHRNDVAIMYNGNFKRKNYIDFTIARNQFTRITEDKRYYHETRSFDTLIYNMDSINFLSYFSRLNYARQISDKIEIMSGLAFTNDKAKGDRIINKENGDSSIASFTEWALYAEIRYKLLKNIQFMASARGISHSVYDGKFTPAFQMKYDVTKEWNIRASYSQGYRSPDLKELYIEFIDLNHFVLGNVNLRPETSIDKQMSITYSKNSFNLNLGAYHTSIKDRILLVEIEPPLKYKYLNFDNYTVYGFQGGFDITVKDLNLQSNANLGFWSTGVHAEDVPVYGQVFDLNNNLNYLIPKINVNITLNHRYNGKQPNYSLSGDKIYINTLQASNFIDASLTKKFFSNKFALVIGVKNVTDIKTLRIDGSVGGIHQGSSTRQASLGRSFFATVKYNF